VAKYASAAEPVTLIATVTHGQVPVIVENLVPCHNRASPPTAPPTKTTPSSRLFTRVLPLAGNPIDY
jgi:hypothetical protein